MSELIAVFGLLAAGVVVFASGFVLHRAGSPYGSALLNLHKLVDLAAVVLIAARLYRANSETSLSVSVWAVVGVTGALVVALFATGAIASASKSPARWVLRVHQLAPWLALVLAAAAVYLARGA